MCTLVKWLCFLGTTTNYHFVAVHFRLDWSVSAVMVFALVGCYCPILGNARARTLLQGILFFSIVEIVSLTCLPGFRYIITHRLLPHRFIFRILLVNYLTRNHPYLSHHCLTICGLTNKSRFSRLSHPLNGTTYYRWISVCCLSSHISHFYRWWKIKSEIITLDAWLVLEKH